jgi:hypothetical protein
VFGEPCRLPNLMARICLRTCHQVACYVLTFAHHAGGVAEFDDGVAKFESALEFPQFLQDQSAVSGAAFGLLLASLGEPDMNLGIDVPVHRSPDL